MENKVISFDSYQKWKTHQRNIKEDIKKITCGEVTSVHLRGDFTWIDLKFFIPGVKTLDSLSSNISRP